MSEVIENELSYLDMSDEDLMKVDPSTFETVAEPVVPVTEVAEEVVEPVVAVAATTEAVDATADDEETEVVQPKDEVVVVEAKDGVADKEATTPEVPEAVVIDYKAEYERLMTPFKANGREVAVKNIDDAVSLMQMGANYNKKMAALKPNLKLMKMLENNGLLTEEKINFLIDVEKKNPSAINKLVKDSGVDLMDLDADKASDYTPTTYKVDDRELELDTVLDSIQDTPTYNRTLDIVSTKWDGASKQVIAGQPQLLKVINDHIQSGVYDIISKEVDRERVFGRLTGLSDIDAYRQMGDAIQARGGFDRLGHQGQQTPPAPVVVQPKPKVVDDTLNDKKRAAGSTKPAASSQSLAEFNPLALSDEEFSKLAQSRFK
jgi:hypothetical protein